MIRYLSTDKAPAPFSRYSQAVEVPAGSRLLFISGQVGVAPDGALAASPEGQHEAAWRSILAILEKAGLGPEDLVDVTAYVTDAADVRLYREVRDRMLAGAAPASTILIVAGLADPRWRVEISAVAAKA